MLTLVINPSRLLAALLGAMHGIAVVSLSVLPIPLWLRLAAVILVGWSFFHGLAKHASRRSPSAIRGLRIGDECRCEVALADGEWFEVELESGMLVTPFLTVLNFRRHEDGKHLPLVIMPDTIDSEGFRKLRVVLKWECSRCPDEDVRARGSEGS
jgi:toxin CptA